ncbi:MAG: HWE histidine kinase domain-containing protein [bacterium]
MILADTGRAVSRTAGSAGRREPLAIPMPEITLIDHKRSKSGLQRAASPPDGGGARTRLQTAIRLAGATLFGQDRDLRYTWIENPMPHFGSGEVIGKTDEEVLNAATAAVVVPVKRAVLESGKAQRVEYREDVDDDSLWFDLRIEPETGADGAVNGLTCACIDITERLRWEEHQRILLLELAHRSKNLLAVVQSLANQSGKNAGSVEEFKRRFFGRLHSLSRAHEILSDYNWRGAGLRELIRSQVLMYAGDAVSRIRYEGPPVYLRPNAAQHVGLALHELTTNALKHGALKGARGDVEISWSLSEPPDSDAPPGLTLQWSETQDKPVDLPPVRNFGRILLESVVPAAVTGQSCLEMGPGGILYRLDIRSDELVERPGTQA